MTRVKLQDFLTRHQFQAVDVQKLAQTPATAPLAQPGVDVDGDGVVKDTRELEEVYKKLLALDTTATLQQGFETTSPAGAAYSGLATLLRQKTGTDAPLGTRTLAQTPELAAVFAGGTPPVVLQRVDGKKTVGTGLVQDALNVIAAGLGVACSVNLGANDKNRGMFGPGTEAAVKAFQASVPLVADGVIGAATAAALDAALARARGTSTPTPTPTPPPTPTPTSTTTGPHARFVGDAALDDVRAGRATVGAGARGPHVMKLQQALLDMGFSLRPYANSAGVLVGGVDGAWGGQCETAIKNFQRHARHGFPNVSVSGVVDAATLAALEKLAPAPGANAWTSGQPHHAPVAVYDGVPVRVVVVKDQHRTFLYDNGGNVQGIFSNAVGSQGNATQSGLKKVTGFLNEQDCKTLSQRLWGNDNSFGKRLVDLSWVNGAAQGGSSRSGEELHGTFNYKDMGKDVSHGCMRHYNEDILVIFAALKMGDKVAVVDSLNDPKLGAGAGGVLPPNV